MKRRNFLRAMLGVAVAPAMSITGVPKVVTNAVTWGRSPGMAALDDVMLINFYHEEVTRIAGQTRSRLRGPK